MYFIAFTLFFFVFDITKTLSTQESYIKPRPMWGNGCALIRQRIELICYGGQQKSNVFSEPMYSLSLSKTWSTTEPAWSLFVDKDLNDVMLPLAFFAEAHMPNSNYFFVDGGVGPASKNTQMLYFDIKKGAWNYSSLLNSARFSRRKQHTAVADDKGQIWLWGGVSDNSTYAGPTLYYNTWTVIDTNAWSIKHLEVEGSPPPRVDHTATIISNKYILITGGVIYSPDMTDPTEKLTLNPVSMSSLLLFDIQQNRWYNITAGGNIPAPRKGHSAALSDDGSKIIVFGGGTTDKHNMQFNDVFILDLSTMQWSAPSIDGVPPKPRKYHKSYIVGNYLLIMFGLGEEENGFSDVSVLNITEWTWVSQYVPNTAWFSGNYTYSPNLPNNSIDPLHDPNFHSEDEEKDFRKESETRVRAGIMAGVVSGGVVTLGGIAFLIVSIVVLKRKRQDELNGTNNYDTMPCDAGSSKILEHETTHQQYQKPDNRSSIGYAVQSNDGTVYKPNVS